MRRFVNITANDNFSKFVSSVPNLRNRKKMFDDSRTKYK